MLLRYDGFQAADLTPAEAEFANTNYTVLLDAIADREGITAMDLSYVTTQIALREMSAVDVESTETEGD
jgi:hypothetical protein